MTASTCLLDHTNTVDTMSGYRSSHSQQQRPVRYPPSPRRSGPRASDEPSWRDSDRHRSREQQRPADRSDSRSRQRDHRDTKDSRHESHNSRRSDDSSRDKRAGGRSPSRDHPQRPRSSSQRRSPPRAATASRDKRDSNSRTGPAAAVPKQPPAQNSNAFELLEKFLGKQAALQDVLLPSANNVSTIFVGREDVLEFITVQEWVNAKLNLQLQLLTGVFVAVPATGMEPSSSRESLEAEKAVPVRIRQVKSVRVSGAAAGGPEQAKVLLVGGGVVEAGQLGEQPLLESQDNEELCCELASLQLLEVCPVLRLYDLAHTVWRLRLCAALEEMLAAMQKEQAELRSTGCDDPDILQSVEDTAHENMRLRIKQLPKASYMKEVAEYVEHHTSDRAALQQQLQEAGARWQQYVQQKRLQMNHPAGGFVLPPGLGPQQQQQQQMERPCGGQQLQSEQQSSKQLELSVGSAYLNSTIAPAVNHHQQQQQLTRGSAFAATEQQQQQPPMSSSDAIHAAAPADFLSSDMGPPASTSVPRFTAVDDYEFFDDPTGLGGLSPPPQQQLDHQQNQNHDHQHGCNHGIRDPADQINHSLSKPSQPHQSLGFGMGSGTMQTTAGNKVQEPLTETYSGGFKGMMQRQQSGSTAAGDANGTAAADANPLLQPFMSKYSVDAPAAKIGPESGGAAAAAAGSGSQQQQQQQQHSAYTYWVEQGDKAAAEQDPKRRRAQEQQAAVTAAMAPAVIATAAAGLGVAVAGTTASSASGELASPRPGSVFSRLGPVNLTPAAPVAASEAQQQSSVAAAGGSDKPVLRRGDASSKHRSSSRDRDRSRKRDKDSERSHSSRDRDKRSRTDEQKISRRSSSSRSPAGRAPCDAREFINSSRSKRINRDEEGKSSKSKGLRRGEAGKHSDESREPSPGLASVLERLVQGRSNPRTGRSRSRDRAAAASRDRYRDPGRARSSSPGGRGRREERHRSRSPRLSDADLLLKWGPRLQGADELLINRRRDEDRTPEGIIRSWLHGLADMKRAGLGCDKDGFFELQYLKRNHPVPHEAIMAWGAVHRFLHNHPAIIFRAGTAGPALVGVDDSVDIDAVSALSSPRGVKYENFRPPQLQGLAPGSPPFAEPAYGFRRSSTPGSADRPPHAVAMDTPISPHSAPAAQMHRELKQFTDQLHAAVAAAPDGYVHVAQSYYMLPPGLAEKVKPGAPIDIIKLVDDHITGLQVVAMDHVKGLVVQRRPPGKAWVQPRVCSYWHPGTWDGCFKGARCDFRHDVVPGMC